jgi:hypothetical protein
MQPARLVLLAATIVLALPLTSVRALPLALAVVPQGNQDDHGGLHSVLTDTGLVSVVQNVTRPFMDPAAATRPATAHSSGA